MSKCIICGENCATVMHLSAEKIKDSLFLLMGDDNIHSIDVGNYQILRCGKCELEFATPQLPGSKQFYEWLVKNKSYYPSIRWEWRNVIEYISGESKNKTAPLIILDVGCGTGTFLEYLVGNHKIRAIGIDMTESSIEICKSKGIEAYSCQLTDMHQVLGEEADVITAFHVLEHVPDPLAFVESASRLLRVGGSIFVSTPYSPMSIEENWFDPLNHPPHHLTRWSEKSYAALAEKLGMSLDFEFPQNIGLISRVFSAISVRAVSPFISNRLQNRKLALIIFILMDPMVLIREIIKQLKRKRVMGRVAPNSILVRFTKK